MDFSTNLILITGASGWLGKGVLHSLLEGIAECERLRTPISNTTIRVLVLPGEEKTIQEISDQIEVVVGDLKNSNDCQRFTEGSRGGVLLHLAGIIHPTKRIQELYDVNLRGTQNLLEAGINSKIKRAVVMSSNSPLGCNPFPDHLFDEQSPYHPYMNYGRSKYLMEQHIREIQQAGMVETVIIRAPWFYGPHQPPRQSLFFQMIRDGKAPIVGSGENRRSMAYIENLAQGILLAAMTPHANGQTYWIADEQPYTMNQIIDTVEYLLESEFHQACKHQRLRLPSITSEIAYFVDWIIQKMGFYHQKIHVLSEMNKTIACSINKAKKELHYQPTVGLEEGMRRSLQWLDKEDLLHNL